MTGTSRSWQDEYRELAPAYDRLLAEARFSLNEVISREAIKLHSLTGRVKLLDSLEDKAQRKGYTAPLEQTPDVVGVRVVVLFLNDLPRVADLVSSVFDVLSTEDKIDGDRDPSTFGYMSQHFEAVIPDAHRGPRYDDLRGIRFEIQVRTLLMDAWANVSHYLAYKGDSSIPPELRRDFHALSGLFYVADKHFELFFGRTELVQEEAEQQLSKSDTLELNLDTLAAFLLQRFPDREHSSRQDVAVLVDELLMFGIDSTNALEALISNAAEAFEEEERTAPPFGEDGRRFFDIGVVRCSLAILNKEFAKYQEADIDDDE